jgi:hypothetical protein
MRNCMIHILFLLLLRHLNQEGYAGLNLHIRCEKLIQKFGVETLSVVALKMETDSLII